VKSVWMLDSLGVDGLELRRGTVGEGGGVDSALEEKNMEKGLRRAFRGYLEPKGGCRTFRYMLNDRRALLACGTYLPLMSKAYGNCCTNMG
jgi:hypothetical protein